jgi:glycosyltransferase involved in cell wall biosynthesis
VVCLVRPAWEMSYVDELKPYCEAVYPILPEPVTSFLRAVASLPTAVPATVAYSYVPQMKACIDQLLRTQSFDLIHTDFIRAAQYTAGIRGIPKLFDAVDSLTLAYGRALHNPNGRLFTQAVALEEWLKMRTYEPGIVRAFDRVTVTSPADQQFLAGHGPAVDVIPGGVDLDYFSWSNNVSDENNLIYLGKMNYYVNVDTVLHFCRRIFPLIKKANPDVKLSIVGWNPTGPVLALKKDMAVTVTGGVPDVRPYLARAAVCVCPLKSGSGIQNKMLQSMAIGTPVVASSIACQALNVRHREHVMVADEPEDFAAAVLELLTNKTLRQRLSRNARQYVEQNHNWAQIGVQLEASYSSIIG